MVEVIPSASAGEKETEHIKRKIMKRFRWLPDNNDELTNSVSFGDTILKDLGQSEVAKLHNQNLGEAVDSTIHETLLLLSEKIMEIMDKIEKDAYFLSTDEDFITFKLHNWKELKSELASMLENTEGELK